MGGGRDSGKTTLQGSNLTRNVREEHLREIFGAYSVDRAGVDATLSIDEEVDLPKGYGYVEFRSRTDAEDALAHMNGGQIDGSQIKVEMVHVPAKKAGWTGGPWSAPGDKRARSSSSSRSRSRDRKRDDKRK